MIKSYKLASPYTGKFTEVIIRSKQRYDNNSGILLQSYDLEGFPYTTITVDIDGYELSNKNCAFINVNDCSTIPAMLESYHIAKFTGKYAYSGYCAYPEYEFTDQFLRDVPVAKY